MSKFPFLSEKAQALIIEHLQNNINDQVSDPDNQYDDGIGLEPIESNAFYTDEAFLTLQPPCIYVLDGRMEIDQSSSPNYLKATDYFTIVVSCEDVGADRLNLKARRYSRLINSLLNRQDLISSDGRLKLTCLVNSIDFSTSAPSRNLTDAQQYYRKDAIIGLQALHFESNEI